jgi:hypothetical protein
MRTRPAANNLSFYKCRQIRKFPTHPNSDRMSLDRVSFLKIVSMLKNTSDSVLLRKTFKRSRKELRDALRALYRKTNRRFSQSASRSRLTS